MEYLVSKHPLPLPYPYYWRQHCVVVKDPQ